MDASDYAAERTAAFVADGSIRTFPCPGDRPAAGRAPLVRRSRALIRASS